MANRPFLFSSRIHTLLDFFQAAEFFNSRDEETEVGCFGSLALPPSRGLNGIGWPEGSCIEVWHFWVWGGFGSPTLRDSNWAELENVWESHKVLPKLNKLAPSIPSQVFWIVQGSLPQLQPLSCFIALGRLLLRLSAEGSHRARVRWERRASRAVDSLRNVCCPAVPAFGVWSLLQSPWWRRWVSINRGRVWRPEFILEI